MWSAAPLLLMLLYTYVLGEPPRVHRRSVWAKESALVAPSRRLAAAPEAAAPKRSSAAAPSPRASGGVLHSPRR